MTNTYTVHFRNDAKFATEEFKAKTPEEALAKAREFLEEHGEELDFEAYDGGMAVDEIEIRTDDEDELAVWRSEDLRLRLAAGDLREAVDQARQALNTAPRFRVPGLECDSYDIAALCERALAKAKGETA